MKIVLHCDMSKDLKSGVLRFFSTAIGVSER